MTGELNFNLLDRDMPAKVAGSITNAYQAGQDRDQANALAQANLQQAQSQNELSKYTLAATRRTDEQQQALDLMMKQGFDPKNPAHRGKLRGMGAPGMAMEKWLAEQENKVVENQGKQATTAKAVQEFMAQGMQDMVENPSDANVTAWTEDLIRKGFKTPEEAQAGLQQLLAMSPEQRRAHFSNAGLNAGQRATAQTAEAGRKVTMRGQDIGAATSRRGQNMTAETARAGQKISQGQLEVAQGGLKLRQEGLTELPPKEVQKREAKYPAATAAVKEATAANEQLVKDLEALKVHKGLDGITGVVYGRTPSVTEASREAKAKLDKILARGGFSELAKMRAASPTGGALGNISDTEGKYLRSAFAAMDPVQSKESFQKAIDDAITELQGSNARIQDAYDMTYEYKAPRAAKAPVAEVLSPAEQAELDALRKRFNK